MMEKMKKFFCYKFQKKYPSKINSIYRLLIIPVLIFILNSWNVAVAKKSDSYDPIQTALALNYATVSLYKILSYNDVIILDEEYNNIINNINLSKIEDEEIVTLFTDLMDKLTLCKINDKQKEFIKRKFEGKVENVLYDSFAQDLSNTMNSIRSEEDPYSSSTIALASIGSSYFNYRRDLEEYKEKRDEAEWQIDALILSDLNYIRKDFFKYAWQLIKKYDFPDNWRLTEKQVEEYVETLKDLNSERRFRKLKRMVGSFNAYPPFWFYLGQSAQELGKTEEALQLYNKFEETRKGIFRKDPFYVSVCMNRISLLDSNITKEQTIKYLDEIIKNSNNQDWNNYLFCALQYLKYGEYNNAKKLIIRNLDNTYEVSLHNRILAEIMLKNKSDDQFSKLIDDMIKNDKVKNQDILYLYSKTNNKLIIKKIKDQILAINLSIKEKLIGDEDVLLEMPIKWIFEDLSATLEFGSKKVEKLNIKMNQTTRQALYSFENVFDISEFIDTKKEVETTVNLQHKSLPIKVIFMAKVKVIEEEKSTLANWTQDKINNKEEDKGFMSKWAKKIDRKIDDAYTKEKVVFELSKIVFGGEEYYINDLYAEEKLFSLK